MVQTPLFVNRIADKSLAIDDLIENPTQTILSSAKRENIVGQKHLSIPLPAELYGQLRANSKGLDLANDSALVQLNQTAQQFANHQWSAAPMGEQIQTNDAVAPQSIINPARHSDVVGYVQEATTEQVEQALNNAQAVQDIWARTAKDTRASYLLRAADLMEARLEELMVLLCRESGKTYANAIAEVREAVDFLRYYATQMIDLDANAEVEPLGTMLCISPWNFPLAIFTGQVAAALVAGNTVIAKPAEQTPLIAAQAIQILWQAGVPQAAVQLMPGRGETVGAQLSAADASSRHHVHRFY